MSRFDSSEDVLIIVLLVGGDERLAVARHRSGPALRAPASAQDPVGEAPVGKKRQTGEGETASGGLCRLEETSPGVGGQPPTGPARPKKPFRNWGSLDRPGGGGKEKARRGRGFQVGR